MYDALYAGWKRIDRASMADGAKARIESLWLSPNIKAPGLDLEAA
jgi:DNA adenine methylase